MFGFHVNRDWRRGGSLPDNIGTALEYFRQKGFSKVRSVQVFMSSPREQKLKFADAEALSECLRQNKLWGVAHATYLDRPWPGSKNPTFSQKFIREELRTAEKAGLQGLVVHLQTETPEETASVLDRLVVSGGQGGAKIYLETPHVKPEASHYETPNKLKVLYDLICEKGLEEHFGLCIDTAHLWACGVDLSSFEEGNAWITELEASGIPPHCLLFHLNDSCKTCGGGVDHHAPLAEGNIWKEHAGNLKDSGLAAFVDFIERNDLPCILERSNATKKDQPPRAELFNDLTVLRKLGGDV